MHRWRVPVVVGMLLAVLAAAGPAPAVHPALDEALAGLGERPEARLEFLFEVTFLKIDVADVGAWLAPAESTALDSLAAAGPDRKERVRAGARRLLGARDLACGFRFRRDGGFDRFLGGMRGGLAKARDEGLLTPAENDTVWSQFAAAMEPLSARGAAKGDRLVFRAGPEGVRILYLDLDGRVLLDEWRPGGAWSRGVRGLFFCRESRFGEKLVRSRWSLSAGGR